MRKRTLVSAYETQQARKRAEIDYGPWPARLAWLKKSRLVEERRALRYNEDGQSLERTRQE